MKIGLLTLYGSELIVPLLEQVTTLPDMSFSVFIDGGISEKDQRFVEQRLEETFKIRNLSDVAFPSVPCYFTGDHNGNAALERIGLESCDYLVNGGTPRILKKPILGLTGGVINCHPGLLPMYRGCSAVEWSISNNDAVGATTHFMSEEIDRGELLLQKVLPVSQGETYRRVRTRMVHHQIELIRSTLELLSDPKFNRISLPKLDGGRYFKPIPDALLEEVKSKLAAGNYISPPVKA